MQPCPNTFDISTQQRRQEPLGNRLPALAMLTALRALEKRLVHPALSPLHAISPIDRHVRTALVSAFHSFKLLELGFLPDSLHPLTLALANLQALSTLTECSDDAATSRHLSALNNLCAHIAAHPIHEIMRRFTLGDLCVFDRYGTQCDEASKGILEVLQHITNDIIGAA